MPIYEYRCSACGAMSPIFFRSLSAVGEARCPQCRSDKMERLISKVAIVKGEGERLEELDASRLLSKMERPDLPDVGSFARWARQVGGEYDSALGTNFRELAERAEAGEDPIERADPGHSLRYALEKRKQEVSGSAEDGGDGSSST